MTVHRGRKATREWTSPDGIRCREVEGEVMVDARDLAKWMLSIDPNLIPDLEKRAAFIRFQREAAAMPLAAQHRRAIALLEEIGAEVPDELRNPFTRVIDGGA